MRRKSDEPKFFAYLRNNAAPLLLELLRSIDNRACIEIYTIVLCYLRPSDEAPFRTQSKQRARIIFSHLTRTISCLQKAATVYKDSAAIEIPGRGSLVLAGKPEQLLFADALESEAARLTNLLAAAKKVYNRKRF